MDDLIRHLFSYLSENPSPDEFDENVLVGCLGPDEMEGHLVDMNKGGNLKVHRRANVHGIGYTVV
jgi:hypothetical protein